MRLTMMRSLLSSVEEAGESGRDLGLGVMYLRSARRAAVMPLLSLKRSSLLRSLSGVAGGVRGCWPLSWKLGLVEEDDALKLAVLRGVGAASAGFAALRGRRRLMSAKKLFVSPGHCEMTCASSSSGVLMSSSSSSSSRASVEAAEDNGLLTAVEFADGLFDLL